MKQTELKAFQRSKKFKETHKVMILNALTKPLTVSQIALKLSFKREQVAKRMVETQRDGLVFIGGYDGSESVYIKSPKFMIQYHKDEYTRGKDERFRKVVKSLLSNYEEQLSEKDFRNLKKYLKPKKEIILNPNQTDIFQLGA